MKYFFCATTVSSSDLSAPRFRLPLFKRRFELPALGTIGLGDIFNLISSSSRSFRYTPIS